MRRLTVLGTALCLMLAACGGGNTAPAKTIHVAFTPTFFSPSQARAGDKIVCGAGGGSALIPTSGGVSSSTGLRITVQSDGKIKVQCPLAPAPAEPTA
jgi:hypothetical protein